MDVKNITPILNVSDIGKSLAWFEKLGWKRCWTYNDGGLIEKSADESSTGPANFAAVGSGECEIFLCRDGQGSRAGLEGAGQGQTKGMWMSWWLQTPAEVDAAYAQALAAGMNITHPPTNEPWGCREFHLRHPDGHVFRVSAGLHE